MRPRSAQRARRQRRSMDLIKARAHGAHAEVQPPTARRPARAGHSRGFLVNNFFWKILVTLSSEKFMPVPVGTDPSPSLPSMARRKTRAYDRQSIILN